MGVITTESERVSAVAPARLYKAIVLDFSNVFPKALSNVESVEIVEGDGGPGSIKKFALTDGLGYVKHRVDVVDPENYVYHYTVIEGRTLSDHFEKISYEYKTVASSDGGSIIKSTTKYYTKGDAQLADEHQKVIEEISYSSTKAIEDYLLANPDYN